MLDSQWLAVILGQGQHIKPAGPMLGLRLPQKVLGTKADAFLLAPIDRVLRVGVLCAGTGLDLDEDDRLAVEKDQIQLTNGTTVIAGD
jgi:hypothetical protein